MVLQGDPRPEMSDDNRSHTNESLNILTDGDLEVPDHPLPLPDV